MKRLNMKKSSKSISIYYQTNVSQMYYKCNLTSLTVSSLASSGSFTDTIVMLDSSSYVSVADFDKARQFTYELLLRVDEVVPIKAAIHTFDDFYSFDTELMMVNHLDQTGGDLRKEIDKLNHLMLMSPAHDMLKKLTHMADVSEIRAQTGANVKPISIIFMNSNTRYHNLTYSLSIEAEDKFNMAFVMVDASVNGDLRLNHMTINGNHIIRLNEVDITNVDMVVSHVKDRLLNLFQNDPQYTRQNGIGMSNLN